MNDKLWALAQKWYDAACEVEDTDSRACSAMRRCANELEDLLAASQENP